ncbi:T9SS type A sorting domain-containing protein [Fibrella aquatilis]|uniref:T9SS type A sorting domain-containing protein n=1 Tax=Fibrella aquatilis TaxID=2817059 RepID=A0A939JYP6_9BACT|nr:T9SS type A sorting domain-containing protein [Fibrella aquatilis]MBO0930086.1 T9SS type A sorting domain-containing protein [Fibrella aquatilis]
MKKQLALLLLLTGAGLMASAQVKFKVSRQNNDTYLVSMVPQQSLAANVSITGTVQVTVKMKASEGFDLAAVQSQQAGVEWDNGTLLKSPDGARDYDYLSVALKNMGARGLTFEANKEVPLFTFRNAGSPVSKVQLIDNKMDELVLAKQNRYNVLNHMSVLGYGRRNAYEGNLLAENTLTDKVGLRSVFPNPANDHITVTWDNYVNGYEGEVKLAITDAGTGRVLSRDTAYMRAGANTKELSVETLNAGAFLISLEKDGAKLGNGLKFLIVR